MLTARLLLLLLLGLMWHHLLGLLHEMLRLLVHLLGLLIRVHHHRLLLLLLLLMVYREGHHRHWSAHLLSTWLLWCIEGPRDWPLNLGSTHHGLLGLLLLLLGLLRLLLRLNFVVLAFAHDF